MIQLIVSRRNLLLLVLASMIINIILIVVILKRSESHGTAVTSSNKEEFRPESGDVFVFWHIQRTGGTYFNRNLVNLNVSPPCQCYTKPPVEGACRCRNQKGNTWLFSRLTTSSPCGVHPPLQELFSCVPAFLSAAEEHDENTNNRYLLITILREPIRRYLSEWHHLQAVPPWPSSCYKVENPVEACIKASNNTLSLVKFLQCPGNPANNRIVRMLTKDSVDLCDELNYEAAMSSAKKALNSLHFIGLTDQQANTKKLFEAIFHVKFLVDFKHSNRTEAETLLHSNLSNEVMNLLQTKNSLDVELYTYAKSLFHNRLLRYL